MPEQSTKISVKLTDNRKQQYLEILAKCGNKSAAAAQVGVSVNAIHTAAKNDPKFKEAIEIARGLSIKELEDVARTRAIEGEEEDVWFQGQVVGKKKVKSDKLLMFLLQANDKDRFGSSPSNQTNNTLNINGDATLGKLAQFLKVDMKDIESAQGDIVEGEYTEE